MLLTTEPILESELISLKETILKAWEMIQQLKDLAVKTEDLTFDPQTQGKRQIPRGCPDFLMFAVIRVHPHPHIQISKYNKYKDILNGERQ